jgi:hypothetical protein
MRYHKTEILIGIDWHLQHGVLILILAKIYFKKIQFKLGVANFSLNSGFFLNLLRLLEN